MAVTIDYTGKTVVVIGGTSGINLGVAEAFARHGAKVAVASRSEAKVAAAVSRLQAHSATAIGRSFDVRNAEAVREGLKNFHDALGPFDVLVSGAAGNFPATAVGMSPNAFRSVVDIDLIGSYHVAREGFAHFQKPGGALIHISAPQAFVPAAMQAHVCAAKAGVDMLTRTLAMEWGPHGLRVNSIVPGPIAGTEGMARLAPTPELKRGVVESVPLKRDGTPDDIAHAALFLGSPLASYLTGAVIAVDGGWSLGGFGTVMAELAATLAAQSPSKA
jgi:NAD(P)-dependent dehydrogenase (short-subunit alcohol dehydrogenase family)